MVLSEGMIILMISDETFLAIYNQAANMKPEST